MSPDVHAELNSQKALSLHITLRSNVDKSVALYKYLLPWGNRNSIILIAVASDGRHLERTVGIDDPSPEQVIIEPGKSLSGDIDLYKRFAGLQTALKKSDILLFWAYRSPADLRVAEWSGGWILLPQHK